MALSPDGRRLAWAVREVSTAGGTTTAAAATAIHVWDLDSAAEPIATADGVTGPVVALTFAPEGARVAVAGGDGSVCVLDVTTGRATCPPLTASSAATGLAFSPDGKRLAAAGMDDLVRLWDAADGHELLSLRGLVPPGSGHYGFTARVEFSPDGSRLAANAWDGSVTIWDGGSR